MNTIYHDILESISQNKKLLAILIDPEKMDLDKIPTSIYKVNKSKTSYVFVGGSTVDNHSTQTLVTEIKKYIKLPVILFPGDVTQITSEADALLFLSLISGRNSEYLIGKHIQAVSQLKGSALEVIPTGYILIENGKETSVQRVTNTLPLKRNNIQEIVDTAKAGELLGMKLIYLEAGSGAIHPVSAEIISEVKKELQIPLIVGGGIRSKKQLEEAYNSGADMIVIGTAFEEDKSFFEQIQ